MTNTSQTLRIDIISDVMCPWCVIGYRQLAAALEISGTPHEIQWHPFELNPQMPPEGQDIAEHLAQKYGTTPEQSSRNREQMKALGAEVAFDFQYSDGFRMHNTFNAHQLLHWANQQGRMHDLKQALFAAHFTDGRNMSDIQVLADVASEIGLDRDTALTVLEDQRYADDVRNAEFFWIEQGISGVPAMVFDRKHLITGAQGTTNYTRILERLAELRSEH